MSEISDNYNEFMESDISENYRAIVETFKLFIQARVAGAKSIGCTDAERQVLEVMIKQCQEYIA